MTHRSFYSAFDWYGGEYEGKPLFQKCTSNRSRENKDATKAINELASNRGYQWSQFGLK
jgi:hypothetical protein